MILPVLAILLILNVLVSLIRVVRGPTARDRLTGALFAGTTGAAVLAVASVITDTAALRDTALVIVALAAIVVIARAAAEREVR